MRQQTLAVAEDGSFEKYRKAVRCEVFSGRWSGSCPGRSWWR